MERATALCETDIIQTSDLPPAILAALQIPESPTDSGMAALPAPPLQALFPLRGPGGAPVAPPAPTPVRLLRDFLREQESAHIARALEACKGDKEQAAILLGISLATLYRKLAGED